MPLEGFLQPFATRNSSCLRYIWHRHPYSHPLSTLDYAQVYPQNLPHTGQPRKHFRHGGPNLPIHIQGHSNLCQIFIRKKAGIDKAKSGSDVDSCSGTLNKHSMQVGTTSFVKTHCLDCLHSRFLQVPGVFEQDSRHVKADIHSNFWQCVQPA